MPHGRGRAFWEKLAREVEAGASRYSTARKYRVSPTWLGEWCRRLCAEPGRTATLLPVHVVEDRARRIELTVGAAHLSFEEGTDPEYVAQLTKALAQ